MIGFFLGLFVIGVVGMSIGFAGEFEASLTFMYTALAIHVVFSLIRIGKMRARRQ